MAPVSDIPQTVSFGDVTLYIGWQKGVWSIKNLFHSSKKRLFQNKCRKKLLLLLQLFYGLLNFSGTTRVSWYQKCKTKANLDLLEQETASNSGISWAICKSAPHHRQITMPAPITHYFTRQMPFLPPNQQRQSTEGNSTEKGRKLWINQLN